MMSQGNAAAQIGSATPATDKIPQIGTYIQDPDAPGPGSIGPYFGVQGITYWNNNWLGEDAGFLAPSNSGVAAGKTAQWSTSGASPITVPADGRVTITGGTAVAASGTGLSKVFIPAATVIPAGSWFWAFLI
jgi:hypothetical protein